MIKNSIWLEGFEETKTKAHLEKKQVDVCIIGGGIAGMSVAYELKDCKLDIVLIDKGTIGFGATAYTTAKISYLQELPYSKIASMHGEDYAYLYYQSQKEAFDRIAEIIQTHKIDCDYETVEEYVVATQTSDMEKLKKEESYLKKWNIPYTTYNTIPLPLPATYALSVTGAVFHPLKYVYGLKSILEKYMTFYENICAKEITNLESGYRIETDAGTIEAKYVVVATHYPFFIKPGFIPFKTHVEKSYILASLVKNPQNLACITTGTPLHSIRYHKHFLLYGSGAHALTNHLNEIQNYDLFEQRFQEHFHQSIAYTWSNQDLIPDDGLPLIGEVKPHLYVATGFHTWGMTNGALSGIILSDLIVKGHSIYEKISAVKRKWNLIRIGHFLVDASRYGKIYLQTTLIQNPSFYQNHVCVTYENGKRIGIYIDAQGQRHKVLNTCPHMKCHLIFNEKEKTWDCPCHSSRFDIDGNVIRGPSKDSISFP